MSNTSVKVAIALFMVLTPPAASFARGGHGGGHAGSVAMGGFARPAGSGAMGNVPISGIARGPANAGGMNNVAVDPSGVGNVSRIAPLPQPHIAAVAIARTAGSRNSAAPSSTNSGQQLLPDAPDYDPSYFPGRGYNYYAGPGYYDRGYGGPRFTIRGW